MTELPRGWAETTLRQVAEKITDGSHNPPKEQPAGLPMLSARNIRGGMIWFDEYRHISLEEFELEHRRTRISKGDVLLTIVGAIGRSAVVETDEPFTLQRSVAVLGEFAGLSPHYLQKYTSGPEYQVWLLDNAKGTAQKGVYLKKLADSVIKVAPLAEQKRIVAKLDTLNAKSARARTELARVETLVPRYKQAVLSKAFSGELTREWRQDGEWPALVRLGDVAGSFAYGSAAKSQKSGSIPVLRMGNIQNGKLDWADLVYTDDKDEIEKYRLIPGDVLFNRTNSPALVGKTAMYNGERDAIFAGYLIKIVAGPHLDARYLTYALNSPPGREFSWNAKTDGVSQSNISASKLKEFAFAVPSFEEQHEIVRRIESAFVKIDRLAKEAERALELVGRLDEAILAKAFRGELVPQDENDEPASLLLDRIRQARTGQPSRPKRRASTTNGKVHDMARTIIEALAEAKDWLAAQELFARCGVRDGSSTEDVEKLYRQLLDLERQDKVEIEKVSDPLTGAKQGNRVRLRK